MKIILASASPRRRELLGMLGVTDLIIKPAQSEIDLPEGDPGEAVVSVALSKARQVYCAAYRNDVIIAADTVVYADGQALGKPGNEAHARDMLRRLSGRCHTVYTGLALILGGREHTAYEATLVHFREISDTQIDAYVRTGEPMDKAGAYGAQGRGAVFIESIEGDFFNVIGLPLCRLDKLLRENGVEF